MIQRRGKSIEFTTNNSHPLFDFFVAASAAEAIEENIKVRVGIERMKGKLT